MTYLKHRQGYFPVTVTLDRQALTVTGAGSDQGPHSPRCPSGSWERGRGSKNSRSLGVPSSLTIAVVMGPPET